MKIFDVHRHFGHWGPNDIHGKTIDPFENIQISYSELLRQNLIRDKVDCAVVVPVYSPDPTHAFALNEKLTSAKKNLSTKIIQGIWVDPSPSLHMQLREALLLAKHESVFVLKTSPSAWEAEYSPDPISWDSKLRRSMELIWNHLIDVKGILQIHTGSGKSDIQLIEKLIYEMGPTITYHLVHMGNTASGHFYFIPRFAVWIEKGFDIICDTSWSCGFAVRWILREIQEKPILVKRVMFASDEPWSIFQSELAKITESSINSSQMLSQILYENAMAIYVRNR